MSLLQEASGELADLFRAHAHGELQDQALVEEALNRLRGSNSPKIQEVCQELNEVFLQQDPQKKRGTATWNAKIFDLEFDILAADSAAMYRVTV